MAPLMLVDPLVPMMLVAAFLAVTMMAYGLFEIMTKGLRTYEEKYVTGATRTLDAMYLTMTPSQILYLSFLSTLVVFVLVGLSTMKVTLGLIVGGIAFLGPVVTIRILKWRRDKKFGQQLVDALTSLGNGLRAGHSLPAAFEMLARESDNPMGQEMRLVTQEMRLGVTMDDALAHLLRRMPSEDLDILITSVSISREVGGNLAEVFDNISHTIRERHRIQGKVASLTAQGKLQGAIIAMLPVLIAIFLNAYSPELMEPMYTDWRGILMCIAVVAMEAIGVYMIWKIVSIKV